ncbi:PREDICTED: hepatocyte nuclear factor 1-alpha-A-like isoform X1 [Amphimedon queenslandica]|uniref:Homeobox domain-containing protein n=1 Tax=Amphimedon queenslandica TaxID=400682 RepID=A0AAN0II53_AMPQE|nr:PREDICTED: hepatocyte nuclear factor 1-alpha-A-like isoform X1 [Amphimedon queenslandica]|eukprot:XP_003390473.1 PREDICTED: hepatocyte nuclear factor 1-alpha-A-like isoform X1 [Amphimedon queenslandica]
MSDNTNNLLVSVSGSSHVASGGSPPDGPLGQDHDGKEGEAAEENMETQDMAGEGRAIEGENVPDNVRVVIRSLIEHYELSKDQLSAMYDEFAKSKDREEDMRLTQGGEGEGDGLSRRLHIAEEPSLARVMVSVGSEDGENPIGLQAGAGEGETDQQLHGEVNRLQSVVQSAMETYVSSPVVANSSTRSSLSLSDDPLPSTFARELLQRDQSLVAQAIRKYLHQYSIPQREVVEKTGINQSHLSQHFTRGVPIKPAKRVKLYHWFEQDQLQRTGKLLTADGSLTSVLESPKVEGYRRRPRWRWSPVATQILTEAFKKNRFPTREQRLELSRICCEAESAMNNGEPLQVQGASGDSEGITEQRINTWFTNRRKGLVSPSPTTDSFSSLSGLSILQSPNTLTSTPSFDASASDLSLSSSAATPTRTQTATVSPLTIPINLTSTPSVSLGAGGNSTDTISLTTPLALSPANLQALLSQLQVQSNVAPILAQSLGQILVGQLPQGLLVQSPSGGGAGSNGSGPATVSLESITKQLQVVDSLNTGNEATPESGDNEGGVVSGETNSLAVEEIIANTAEPSAINSRQN